jgi:hypothetical protein
MGGSIKRTGLYVNEIFITKRKARHQCFPLGINCIYYIRNVYNRAQYPKESDQRTNNLFDGTHRSVQSWIII